MVVVEHLAGNTPLRVEGKGNKMGVALDKHQRAPSSDPESHFDHHQASLLRPDQRMSDCFRWDKLSSPDWGFLTALPAVAEGSPFLKPGPIEEDIEDALAPFATQKRAMGTK